MLCIDDVRTADPPSDWTKPVAPLPAFDPRASVRLEDENCLVEVSRRNGSITRIRDKGAGLELIREPRLAGSFRFALPIPGKEPWQTLEANWIIGREQRLSSCEVERRKLTLRWNGPLRNYLGEEFGASATMTIALRYGGVEFSLRIDNPTRYPVGEVYFPVLGGIQGLGRTHGQLTTTDMVRPVAGEGCTSAAIFRVFNNMSPFGDQGPEQFYAYPDGQPEPWVGFASAKLSRSAMIRVEDPLNRKLYIRLEMKPATSGTARDDGNWPRPEELRGLPVGVELSFVDTVGGPAGKAYDAAPAFVRFLDGGGAEMRKAWAGRTGAGRSAPPGGGGTP
jgi:hypothetical protein